MVNGETILDVRGVSRHFGGIAALSNVGFSVRTGEVRPHADRDGRGVPARARAAQCCAGCSGADRADGARARQSSICPAHGSDVRPSS